MPPRRGISRSVLVAGCLLLLASVTQLALAPGPGTEVALEVYKTGLWRGRKHVFTFERSSGRVADNQQVEFRVEAASIRNRDDWVSEADRNKIVQYALKNMLEAERYPQIEFRSTRVVAAAAGRYEVEGLLAMRGVARPVVVHVTALPGGMFEGSARLKMTDWGMKPPSAALGAIGTRDEMLVRFRVRGS